MSRSAVILLAMFLGVTAVTVRRQAEDGSEEQEFSAVSGWDPTIRDKGDYCDKMGSVTNDPAQYCTIYNMCCRMNFDPLNGDKCQQMEVTCEGPNIATCVWKNCTEMITTTTTTPAPTTVANVNSAGLLAGITAVGIAFLFC